MKKIITLALAALLSICVLTACGSKETGDSSSNQAESPYNVNEIVATIEKVATVQNPADIGTDYLEWLGIKSDMYVDYAGKYCSITPGVDIILVVEAADGCVDDVKAAMDARQNSLYAENENYDEFLAYKAQSGRINVKGNYAVMVIAGDGDSLSAIDDQYEKIDTAILDAFK